MHPINEFWVKSGWSESLDQKVENGCAEGKLTIDAWNAALDTLFEKLKTDPSVFNLSIIDSHIQETKYVR